MAKKRKAGKAARKKESPSNVTGLIGPTPERHGHVEIRSALMSHKITPVIDTLLRHEIITWAEHSALDYYRSQASQAEDDAKQESTLAPARVMGGGCGGIPAGGYTPVGLVFTAATAETARIERDLGQLRDIARAVAVNDVSLAQWCIAKHGGRERYDGSGEFVAIVPINEKRHMDLARMELRMAARRISR